MIRYMIGAVALGLMVGCSTTPPRFDTPQDSAAQTRIPSRYARIEVATVTLPVYAQGEEIHIRDETGAIVPLGPLWTDAADRAVTLEIATRLGGLTGRLVAPEPWPFRDFPDVKVDLRLDTFLATAAGGFVLKGQVFIAPEEGGPDRALPFDIAAAPTGAEGPAGIAEARAVALADLAEFIASKGLR